MLLTKRSRACASVIATLLGSLVAAGCSKPAEPPPAQPAAMAPGGRRPEGGLPGEGRRRGGRRGRGGGNRNEPIAATASASEIYRQRCQGCHGAQGQGGRGGVPLSAVKGKSPADLQQTIRAGRNRMPGFAGQMTDAQLDALVTHVRQLSPPSGG